MSNLLKSALTCALIAFSFSFYAQVIPISDEGSVVVRCGDPIITLTDSDADGGNYGPDESYTITFCPDGGNAVTFLIDAETAGDTWNVLAGDNLTIYDGDDTNAPIIGNFNTSTLGPVIFFAATVENPTGCLTIQFQSAPNSNGAAGFTSSVNCGNLWQPFSIEMTTEPSEMDEDNYIDICQGETVNFTANGIFPYSDGSGYNQTNENCYFEWDLGDGTELEGYGLTEVTNTYFDQFGYPITLFVTDTLGLITLFEAAVRVSTTPSFDGVISQFQDSICLGNTATLVGGIAQSGEESFGVDPNPSSFIGGGFLAGQTFLPDGSGISYETTIVLDEFPEGILFENESDIIAVCATMEHSYLGDLDISLTCPDGSSINLVTQSGGSTNLGIPWATSPVDGQSANITPGVGFEYCWRPDAANGTFADEAGQNNIDFLIGDGPGTYNDSQMLEGSYLPIQPISDLIGCPINGEWILTVTDNIGADNGYIFSWGIQFDPLIDPNAETYQPTLIDAYWGDDETIIGGNDTIITVQPGSIGVYDYSLFVEDDFGCLYDTTVVLTVVEPVTSFVEDTICNLSAELTVEDSYNGGFWNFTADVDSLNISYAGDFEEANANFGGFYTLTYNDFLCAWTQDHDAFYVPLPVSEVPDEMLICEEFPIDITAGPQHPLLTNYSVQWIFNGDDGLFEVLGNEPTQAIQLPGDYTYTVYDSICMNSSFNGTLELSTKPCVIETFNVFTPNNDGQNDVFYIQSIKEDIYKGSDLFIYNRWGNLMYEKKNYRNDWEMEELVDGTYFFVLNTSPGPIHKGSFTVLRGQ